TLAGRAFCRALTLDALLRFCQHARGHTTLQSASRAMRRSTAKVGKLAGAIGLILSLPFSFASAAAVGSDLHDGGVSQFAESQGIRDAWRDYGLADLTPSFSWALDPEQTRVAPSLFDRGNARFAPQASHFSGATVVNPSPIQVAFVKSKVSDTPLFAAAGST